MLDIIVRRKPCRNAAPVVAVNPRASPYPVVIEHQPRNLHLAFLDGVVRYRWRRSRAIIPIPEARLP
ncbi:MAG: hypothetical protein MZV65_16845 [Chromatiales bacterium]|nr:hypothetical protein [Chromatiales bacterium]